VSEIIIITMITMIAWLGASGESGIVLRVLTKANDSMLLTKELAGWGGMINGEGEGKFWVQREEIERDFVKFFIRQCRDPQ